MKSAIFPGQGSQHIGMGKFLYDNFKFVQELFEEASDTTKVNFKKLCFDGPEEALTLTQNTQPALLLVSVASFEAIARTTDFKFDYFAGHSVGEYAAMVTTGALKFSEAISAVRMRGEFMQSAVPQGKGGMLAIMGLSPEQVNTVCKWAQSETGLSPLEPANYNAPGQIVCSGNLQLIEWLKKNFNKEVLDPIPAKVRFIPLNVSAPFHCSMMKPAEEKMRFVLESLAFENSQQPIVQNVTASEETESTKLRENLILQVSAPVRWIETIEKLQEKNVKEVVEVGCGKVLTGLVKKIVGDNIKGFNLNSLEDLKTIEKLA